MLPLSMLSAGGQGTGDTGPPGRNGTINIQSNGYVDAIPAAPYRICPLGLALSMIESLELSRTHRHLLLLIDGQRSVAELMRLTGKSESGMHVLLRDLEQAAVIQFAWPGSSPY